MILSQCKYADCAGVIEIGNVTKVTAIPRAPGHLALVAACVTCGRNGQYVITRTLWDEARVYVEEGDPPAVHEQAVMAAALIELDAVDTVDELVALWASYRTPPLIEKLMGVCKCDDCERRLYG